MVMECFWWGGVAVLADVCETPSNIHGNASLRGNPIIAAYSHNRAVAIGRSHAYVP